MAAKSNGGGAVLLGCLALLFLYPLEFKGGGSLRAVKFHSLRVWGVQVTPPPEVIDREIDNAADRHGIPRNIFRSLVRVESAKNPNAISPKGAVGLGQVMTENLGRCGLSRASQLLDVVHNLNCSAQILAEELKNYGGDFGKALRVYNAGPKGLKKKIPETEAYAAKVLALSKRYS